MSGLVAALWIIYASECFVRWRPGDWIFRPCLDGRWRAVSEPDVTFLNGRFAFVWTTVLPWRTAMVFTGDSFDRDLTGARLEQLRTHCRVLCFASTALFAAVMVVFPALVLTETFAPAALPLVGAGVLAWASTLAAFFAAHRDLHDRRPQLESWLVAVVSPLTLMRSHQIVVSSAAASAHPATAASLVCDDDEFLRVARVWHFDRPDLRSMIASLVSRRGLLDELLAPPRVMEPGDSRFCRRCYATYRQGAAKCVDCEDVALTPLPSEHPETRHPSGEVRFGAGILPRPHLGTHDQQ